MSAGWHGLIFGAGVALTLVGIYLRWRWPEYRMTTEERLKERRLTEPQAQWRLRLMRFGGPFVVLIAAALFALVFWS